MTWVKTPCFHIFRSQVKQKRIYGVRCVGKVSPEIPALQILLVRKNEKQVTHLM